MQDTRHIDNMLTRNSDYDGWIDLKPLYALIRDVTAALNCDMEDKSELGKASQNSGNFATCDNRGHAFQLPNLQKAFDIYADKFDVI